MSSHDEKLPLDAREKRKRLLMIASSLVVLFVLSGWILFYRNLNQYHRGDYVRLLNFMPEAQAVSSEEDKSGRLTRLTEHLDQAFIQANVGKPPRNVVFRTRYSLLRCKDGISVRNKNGFLRESSDLLKEQNPTSGWTYLKPSSFILFENSKTPYTLESKSNIFQDTRDYSTGLVSWKVSAASHFPDKGAPQIAIFLDEKKLAAIKVFNRNFRTFEVQTFLRQGQHTFSIRLVKGSSDQAIESERNVMLDKIDGEYIGTLLVTPEAASGIDVSYCTSDPVDPFSGRAEVNGDIQDSIQIPPSSRVEFRVVLPDAPKLSFAATILSDDHVRPHASPDLFVNLKTRLGKKTTIFSHKLPVRPEWQELEIDLSKFANQPVILEFESKGGAKFFREDRIIALSNPTISSEKKPLSKSVQHIFIFTADALRASHLGCYGYKKPTSPVIDSFAKDSVLFQNAISQGAATLPSTASLFTSLYASSHKTDVNTSRLPSKIHTLPEILRDQGYLTAGYVKNEFLNPPHGLTKGFLWYHYDKLGTPSERRIPPALKWIEDRRDLPVFVFFHMLHPHSPYIPPPEIANLFQVEQSELASSNYKLLEKDFKRVMFSPVERENLVTLYDAEIRHLDGLFGQFVDHLKKLQIYDESLIVFLSDHGEAFQEHQRWGHGTTLYQEMIHVPLIIKFPLRMKKKGIVVPAYVQTMDLMPTILDVLKLPRPESLQGQSLLPLLSGQTRKHAVFSEVLNGDMLAIIKEGWKYIYFGQSQKEEIYDLRTDSAETSNFSSANPQLLQMFRKERSLFFNRAKDWRAKHIGQDSGEHIVLDENQTEELRALGYIR